jgi:DHA2 family multidrug resistance protein
MKDFYYALPPKERLLITFVLMTGFFMAILDTTIVDIVVPKMMAPLSTDLYGIQWIVTSYMMAAATALLFVENFAKYLGYSYCFILGLSIFTSASFLCGIAQSLPQMILFRVIQGLGEAFLAATTQTLLVSIYPPEKRGLAMGIFGLGVSFAPALGPTLGGFITEHLSWRWIFFVNVPIGVVNVIAALALLPKEIGRHCYFQFNLLSYIFVASATISLLIMLSKGQQLGWFQSPIIPLLLFLSLALFCLYFMNELRSKPRSLTFLSTRYLSLACPWGCISLPLGSGCIRSSTFYPSTTKT